MRRDEDWERHSVRRKVVTNMLAPSDGERGRRPSRESRLGDYVFRSYRDRYFDASDGEGMMRRDIVISIEHLGRLVGVANLKEWRLPVFCLPDDFWNTADDLSQEDTDVAELLGAFWEWHCWPPEYGTVVIFSRLAIDSSLDTGRKALGRLSEYLKMEFGRRASILLLKAFPLEFENSVGPEKDRQLMLQRRSQAMLRLYSVTLRVRPLPDQTFHPGWMWRPLRYCPAPSAEPNLDWRDE